MTATLEITIAVRNEGEIPARKQQQLDVLVGREKGQRRGYAPALEMRMGQGAWWAGRHLCDLGQRLHRGSTKTESLLVPICENGLAAIKCYHTLVAYNKQHPSLPVPNFRWLPATLGVPICCYISPASAFVISWVSLWFFTWPSFISTVAIGLRAHSNSGGPHLNIDLCKHPISK